MWDSINKFLIEILPFAFLYFIGVTVFHLNAFKKTLEELKEVATAQKLEMECIRIALERRLPVLDGEDDDDEDV